MKRKKAQPDTPRQVDDPQDVKFCLNCDDMDDLAVNDEGKDVDALHRRFDNCVRTGRFDGDMCARLFVADDDIEGKDMFPEDDDEA
jgi:hypothetical protein